MNVYERMARSMEIFSSYMDDDAGYHAEHDEFYCGPAPEKVSAEHRAELEELGWLERDDCFMQFC